MGNEFIKAKHGCGQGRKNLEKYMNNLLGGNQTSCLKRAGGGGGRGVDLFS